MVGAPRDDGGGTNTGSAHVFLRFFTGAWAREDEIFSPSARPFAEFGGAVAIDGDRLVVGGHGHNQNGPSSGTATVYERNGSNWDQEFSVFGNAGDRFGASVDIHFSGHHRVLVGSPGGERVCEVAGLWPLGGTTVAVPDVAGNAFGTSVGLTSDALLVGAPLDDDSATDAGAAYAWRIDTTPWSFDSKTSGLDAARDDGFGDAVAVDGNVAVIAAPRDDDGAFDAGAVHVLERSGSAWVSTACLAQGRGLGRFGSAVSVHGDTIAIGAPHEDGQVVGAGAVYVYRRQGTAWVEEQRVVALDGQNGERFGYAVDVRGDDMIVGAPDYDGGAFTDRGRVVYFRRSANHWSAVGSFVPLSASGHSRFGSSVAVAPFDPTVQGVLFAVGEPGYGTVAAARQGRAHAVMYNQQSWHDSRLLVTGLPAHAAFGTSVDAFGDQIFVGSPGNGTSGSVFRFAKASGSWLLGQHITNADVTSGARFGHSIACDGLSLVVGAPLDDSDASGGGSVTLIRRSGLTWAYLGTMSTPALQADDELGSACAVSGGTLLVGAPGRNHDSGVAFAYDALAEPSSYCTGKTNSLGCVPFVASSGLASATSTSNFEVQAYDVLPNEPGFLLYGFRKSNLSFHGGKLCVKLPLRRLLPPKTPTNIGTLPCQGRVSRNFNPRIQSGNDPLLTVGQSMVAQWRLRDPADPAGFGDSLSDALQFTICPENDVMSEATCWTLIRGAAAGDGPDRAEFTRRYLPVVRDYLVARWRSRLAPDELEDAIQDVFVECLRADGVLERVSDSRTSGFRALLLGVVRNVARGMERTRLRRVDQPRSELDANRLCAREDSLSRVFDRAWARSMMVEAARLQAERARPQGERAQRRLELLELRFRDGLEIRKIAELWKEDTAFLHHEYALARREFAKALRTTIGFHHAGSPGECERECRELLSFFA